MKKTLVLGASPNPRRYSHTAVRQLQDAGHEVAPISIRNGVIGGETILLGTPKMEDVHTVTLYLNPARQVQYYDYIIDTISPKRIIFNPGTENAELAKMAKEKGIEVEFGCTLVMISVDTY